MTSNDNEITLDERTLPEQDSSNVSTKKSNRLPDPLSVDNISQTLTVSLRAQIFLIKFLSKISSPFNRLLSLGMFIIIAIIIGVLAVYFTAQRQQDLKCKAMFEPILRNSITQGSDPRDVVVDDFNNDTYLDVVVAAYGTDSIVVFLGYGNGSFAMRTTYSTGEKSFPRSVAVGDLNNDTRLDIVVANYGTNNLGIFLVYGNGSFSNQHTFSTDSSRPLFVVIGDINKDTQLDIIVASSGTNTVGVLLSYGNGSFAKHITYSTGYDSLPQSVSIGDYNNDNHLDVAVANYGTNNVGILLGYGNGTFSNQNIYSTGVESGPLSIAHGDFNNDDWLDIVVANNGTSTIDIFAGNANGTFTNKANYSTGPRSRPYSVTVRDFNNDNWLDIAVVNYANDNIGIFLGYGNLTFASQNMYSTGFGPCSIAVGNFNNDHHLDVIITSNIMNSMDVLMGYYPILFPEQNQYSTGNTSRPQSVTVGDFNQDKQLDIVVANSGANNVGIFIGHSNGIFESEVTYSTGSGSKPNCVVVGDVNNDNWPDIIVANSGSNNVVVLVGCSNGTFAIEGTYPTGNGSVPYAVAVDDFNNDHQLDIVVVNSGTNELVILIGYGNGTFTNKYTYSTGSSPKSVAIGDLNNDNQMDVIVVNYFSSNVNVFIGYGNGSFTDKSTYSAGSSPSSVALGDFNNDGWLDITVACVGDQIVVVLLSFGNGSFVKETVFAVSLLVVNEPQSVIISDFNYDDQLDIAFTTNVGLVYIILGYGNGSFLAPITWIYRVADTYSSLPITKGDFNNDSIVDIAVVNYDFNNLHVLLSYNYGRIASQAMYSTGEASLPISVAVGDFNNDTYLDIITANSGTDSVGLLLGYGNATFENEIKYTTGYSSWPHSVAVGDFNNDTRLDLTVANYGTDNVGIMFGYGDGTFESQTTYSTGSGSSPRSVTVADLNNDNWLDIVVTNEGTDNIALFLTYDTGSFSTQAIYSTISGSRPCSLAAGDFNNDSRLDIVVVNFGSNNINILLGNGNGTFTKDNNYSTGSSPRSVAVGDFNNDGQLDITVANSYDFNIAVLLGYGNGTFAIEGTYSTDDFFIPYAIAVGDLNDDNNLDIVVIDSDANSLIIFIGYGNGTFVSYNTYSTDSLPRCVAIGDLNNDNQMDIIVASYASNYINAFIGYGNGSFIKQNINPGKSGACSIVLADLNNDSRLDIVVANCVYFCISVLLASDDGRFSAPQMYTVDQASKPWSVIVVDINNDNRLDIIFGTAGQQGGVSWPTPAVWGYRSVGVFLGYGNGAFATAAMYSTGSRSGGFLIVAGDFNNDNRVDIAIADYTANNLCVIFGYKYVTFAAATMYSTGNGSRPQSVAISDFNSDKQLDIAVVNLGTNSICILLGYSNKSLAIDAIYSTGVGSHPLSIAAGDFNNDTSLDIVVANSNADNILVFLGYGDGTFVIGKTYSTGLGSAPYSIVTSDFNKDNRLDIVVANYGANNVGIFLGYDNGTFSQQITYTFGFDTRPYSLAIGDFNKDALLDIAIANYGTNNADILLKLC